MIEAFEGQEFEIMCLKIREEEAQKDREGAYAWRR